MPRVEENSTRGTESDLQYIGECTQRKRAGGNTNLTNRKDVIHIQALKQGPHREVDIHQSSAKVQPAGEPGNNLETCLSPVALGGCIQSDDFTRSRSREREDLGYLQGVGLDVLGESSPGESEVVPHKVVNWVSRHQSYPIPLVSPNERYRWWKLTQSVGQPEDGVRRQEQSAFTRVVNRTGHIVVTLADLSIEVGFSISLGVGSSTPRRLGAAPGLLPGLNRDISRTTSLAAQTP